MPKYSQSKIKTWRACHAKFNFRYNEKLRPKRVKRPLAFGKIVHDMIETEANGRDPFKRLAEIEKEQGRTFRRLEEEYGKIVEDTHDIMVDYFSYWEGDIEYVKIGDKKSEFTFEVELAKDVIVEGRIDNIARTKNKLRWLVEHKTGRSYPSEDHRWRNIQSAVYLRVLDIAGVTKSLDGTLWNFIKSKPPARPQILKSGELSKRQLDTLPNTIVRFLNEQNLDPSNHEGLLADAMENRKSYFFRSFSPAKRKVVDSLVADFVSSARQIEEFGHKLKDKNIDRHCDWCEYESICRAELKGSDVRFVKKSEFVVAEKPDDIEVDIEA